MKNLGKQIKMIRLQKGISINLFAEGLGVSTGYLSNLETGKTDTIQLSLLERLTTEYDLILSSDHDDENSDLGLRIRRVHHLLKKLQITSPQEADYLLSIVETGADLFLRKN